VKKAAAVKIFNDRVADDEAYTEIQNMQKLRHENIVTMYGIAIGPIQLVKKERISIYNSKIN
jgi:hypothetical protein